MNQNLILILVLRKFFLNYKMKIKLINYIFVIIDVMIVAFSMYLIYNGYFSWLIFIRALIILLIFSIYRLLGEWLGLPESRKDMFKTRDIKVMFENVLKNKKEREELGKYNKFEERLIKYILKKDNKWKLDIIFLVIYYNPLNWHWIIIQWIAVKLYYMKVWINGNKDVFFKKYFKIDSRQWFTILYTIEIQKKVQKEYKWYYRIKLIYRGIFINPFLRMIMFPSYIKEKILQRYWMEFFKIRLIGLIYSIIFAFYGLYGFLNSLSWIWIIIIIYIYFAVIWPGLSYITYVSYRRLVNLDIIHPNLLEIIENLEKRTLIYKFLSIFIIFVNTYYENYILKKFNIYNLNGSISNSKFIILFSSYKIVNFYNPMDVDILNFWIYEKSYSIPILLYYYNLRLYWMDLWHYELYNFEGKRLYGVKEWNEFIKEHKERAYDYHKVISYIFMDCRRYLGVDIEDKEFIYFIGDDLKMSRLQKDRYKYYYCSHIFKHLKYENIRNEFHSIKNYKIFVELLLFIKCYKVEFELTRMDIAIKIKEDAKNMGIHFGFIDKSHIINMIENLVNIGRSVEVNYRRLYYQLKSSERKLGKDFVFLSLKEIEKFKKKWGNKYIIPSFLKEEEDEYWWKRKKK